jgi:hypothetical protein
MPLVSLNKDPTAKELRTFGLLLPVFFALFGLVVGHRTGSGGAQRAVWGAGAALSGAYLAVVPVRRAVFLGWSYVTYPIGWVVSHLILGFVYFVVITPIGLLVRLFAQDPMQRRRDPSASTYWVRREAERGVRRYFRQF